MHRHSPLPGGNMYPCGALQMDHSPRFFSWDPFWLIWCWVSAEGQLSSRFSSNRWIVLAWAHPLQIVLLQHAIKVDPCALIGSGMQQMGQSPRPLLSGCLNKISSRSSAERFLHSFLCFGRCSFWHLTLQYRTDLQAVHFFNLVPSTSAIRRRRATHHVSRLL